MAPGREIIMPTTIKAGEYLSATELIDYLGRAGERYGLARLSKLDHLNKLTRLRTHGNLPEPDFHFAGRDGWRVDVIDKWIEREREKGIAAVLESTLALGLDQKRRLLEELQREVGEAEENEGSRL